MQAPPGSQRASQKRPTNPSTLPVSTTTTTMTTTMNYASRSPGPSAPTSPSPPGARNASISSKAQSYQKTTNANQQLSQIEKSVTHLLVATKQLLETLTQWSRHTSTEAEVSDVYVRLGYEFNIASRAFNAIGVDTADLGNVPELLRTILEDTLSQEASPASLDRYLPRIRDIIINLLHGLKRKQSKLRQRQTREEAPMAAATPSSSSSINTTTTTTAAAARQISLTSSGSGELVSPQWSDEAGSGRHLTDEARSPPMARSGSREHRLSDEAGPAPRGSSSLQAGRASPVWQDHATSVNAKMSNDSTVARDVYPGQRSLPTSSSSQPILSVQPSQAGSSPAREDGRTSGPPPPSGDGQAVPYRPPPPPHQQQDALAALQRGGDLERRASRRYSAYQISKHLGASPNGMPMLPPPQNSPIPNRGRDVRESMNAVRNRTSLRPGQQPSPNRLPIETSPARQPALPRRITADDGGSGSAAPSTDQGRPHRDSPTIRPSRTSRAPSPFKLSSHETSSSAGASLAVTPVVISPCADAYELDVIDDGSRSSHLEHVATKPSMPAEDTSTPSSSSSSSSSSSAAAAPLPPPSSTSETGPTRTSASPQPGKELTLFLQYKSRIRKIVLQDGYNELSVARLQLAFIEKFAWNIHSNGNDLPDIYIQDPVSGVRHELEDLSDVRDRAVLVLNVETLDEVKKHIDEKVAGLGKLVEDVRHVVEGQQASLQRVSDRQTEAAKDLARLAAVPVSASPPTIATTMAMASSSSSSSSEGIPKSLGKGTTASSSIDRINQLHDVRSLRRDLAVMRQTYSSFVSDVEASMSEVRTKANSVKSVAMNATVPSLDAQTGRTYVNRGKKELGEVSDVLVNRVDDLQDLVEDLRKDVVTRGVRPLPRQLENVGREISVATMELKKVQEFLRREKPKWSKIWEKELQVVCDDRDLLTMQEALAADLQDDLESAAQTFALVEAATKEQMKDGGGQSSTSSRSTSRTLALNNVSSTSFIDPSGGSIIDPQVAKEGVLGAVRALQPNHENRVEAIQRAERIRQKELESRAGGEFKKELGSFVEEGRLKKSGGVEEAERQRRARDDRIRREIWERENSAPGGSGHHSSSSSSTIRPKEVIESSHMGPPGSETASGEVNGNVHGGDVGGREMTSPPPPPSSNGYLIEEIPNDQAGYHHHDGGSSQQQQQQQQPQQQGQHQHHQSHQLLNGDGEHLVHQGM